MNLEELKSAWDADNTNEVHIPQHIKELRQAQHPLDKLKRNMKNEWYTQLGAILFIAFSPKIMDIHPSTYVIFYTSYIMILVISIYYLNTFRLFYKRVSHYTSGTRDSLNEIYYEFKLNVERYHSFGFLLIPFSLIWVWVFSYSRLLESGKDLSTITESMKEGFLIAALILSATVILAVLAWTRYLYTPYIKQIKSVLDELKIAEED